MKKRDFVMLVLAVVGGLCFAFGMCMCLLPEWDAFVPGCVTTAIGALLLLVLAIAHRRQTGKPRRHVKLRTVGITVYGVVAALILGVGMCMILEWQLLIWGMLVGVVGIVLLLGLIPLIKGFQ